MSWRLLLGVAFAALLPLSATAKPPTPSWTISCGAGSDEFASNCLAVAEARGLRFQLSTGDSQVFVDVSARGCDASASRNWWRDEIVGMDYRARRALIEAAMREAAAEVADGCPVLDRTLPRFDEIPDIAALGEPGS